MKVTFEYDKEKDIWCLLNKGKSSSHSQKPTKQYEQLIEKYGDEPGEEVSREFVENYLLDKKVLTKECVNAYQQDWDSVSFEFQSRAESIFETALSINLKAYLTINSRCPYSLEENYFFVTFPTNNYIARRTVMHELWHFYTWQIFGSEQLERMGAQKYGDLKEALTVLLNIECADLLTSDIKDNGYPQHQELRQRITEFWINDKDIRNLWDYLANQ